MRPTIKIPYNTLRSIIAKYKNGMSLSEIAQAIGRSAGVIRGFLLKNGVTLRPRGRPATKIAERT